MLCYYFRYMSLPLIQQGKASFSHLELHLANEFPANSWVGYVFCYIVLMAIYYSNTWNVSQHYPFLQLQYLIHVQNAVQGIPHIVNVAFLI